MPELLVPDVTAFLNPTGCPVHEALDALDDQQLKVNITAALKLENASPTKIARALQVDEKAVRRHMKRNCRCRQATT